MHPHSAVALTPGSMSVRAERLAKHYGDFAALDHVSFEVQQGEFLTLLGPSGSGKTTLLMVIAGFAQPDSGNLYFGNRQILGLAPFDRNLGMVFQNYALFPHMSVLRNVMFPLEVRGIKGAQARRKAEDALGLVGLDTHGSRRIQELSGGQQQRVALARAIVFEPPILLMDEPLSALDKNLREQMQIELRRLHERLGMTTISVTHDQREALTMSDRIAVMKSGRIEQLSSPTELYQKPNSPFVATFIGESALVPAKVSGAKAFVEDTELHLPKARATNGDGMLLLRPEALAIGAAKTIQPGKNVIPAITSATVYQGDSIVVFAQLRSGHEITVRLQSSAEARRSLPKVGDPISLLLDVEDTVVIDKAA